MLVYCSQSSEKLAPLQAWQNCLSVPVVSVLFRCQLWQITNCYQLGYGPFCNCLSLTDRTCRWREPHVWPSFSHPYRPTPPPPAPSASANTADAWCHASWGSWLDVWLQYTTAWLVPFRCGLQQIHKQNRKYTHFERYSSQTPSRPQIHLHRNWYP